MARTYRDYIEQDWFVEPSFIRFRHRFRGHRESYKINADVTAVRYDLHRLYSELDATRINLDTRLTDLLDGKPSWLSLNTP